jgi:branched-chain amino acid transport system ATP-binding protein
VLELSAVSSGYHGLEILHEVSVSVRTGEIVAIVGANGAGKTTTLRTAVGELKPMSGSVTLFGKPVSAGRSFDAARDGLMLVPENRALFGSLTVRENLTMGTWARNARNGFREQQILELFPILAERQEQRAETLSGGQQQMLAIARALMGAPHILLLDEPSTGLSPKFTWDVFNAVQQVKEQGVGVLIVEQNASQVLSLADRAYVLEAGSVVLEGTAAELAKDPRVQAAYLGA